MSAFYVTSSFLLSFKLIGSFFFVVAQPPLLPQIAVVSQDCVLFARSIRENIAYGLEDVPEEEIHRAAKLASAHDFIRKLPNGYDTGANPASVRPDSWKPVRINSQLKASQRVPVTPRWSGRWLLGFGP